MNEAAANWPTSVEAIIGLVIGTIIGLRGLDHMCIKHKGNLSVKSTDRLFPLNNKYKRKKSNGKMLLDFLMFLGTIYFYLIVIVFGFTTTCGE